MVKLLDCTLRDGGYVNNWEFGYDNIFQTIHELEEANVDIIEVGFLKNETYDKNRTIFNSVDQINELLPSKKSETHYAAMIEVVNPIPLDQICDRNDKSIDTIRVIVWKNKHDENGKVVDALEDGLKYCRGIIEKGYNLCIQPARVDQYSDNEFITMVKMFNELNPMAMYIVDSWGTLDADNVLHYIKLAEENLKEGIALGYHGHNNLMQALDNAKKLIEYKSDRDVFIDASVYGIGRGAGNLNIELIANYLNANSEKKYVIDSFFNIYDKCICGIYEKHKWGYSLPYFLAAKYNCNPNYADYYGNELKLSVSMIEGILKCLSADDKVLFTKNKAERYLNKKEKV